MKKIRVAQKLIIFLSKTQLDVSLTRAVKSGLNLLCELARCTPSKEPVWLAPTILHLQSCTYNLAPTILHLQSCTYNLAPTILHLQYCTYNLAPTILHLQSCTTYELKSTMPIILAQICCCCRIGPIWVCFKWVFAHKLTCCSFGSRLADWQLGKWLL